MKTTPGIVEQIRRLVKQRGLSVYRVAKSAGLYVSTAQRILGGSECECRNAEKIARALNCRIVLEPIDKSERRCES